MGRSVGLSIAFLTAALLITGCGVPTGRFSARGGPLYLDGGVSSTRGGDVVQAQASVDDLGLDDPEIAFQPKAEVDWGGLNLSLDGFSVGYEGTGIATADLEIGGQPPIVPGVGVDTSLDLTYVMLKATWDFIPGDLLDAGIGLAGGIVDYDLSIHEVRGIGTFDTSKTVPIVYPVIRVGSLLGPVRIVGYLGGLGLSLNGDKIKYIDGELYAGVRLFGEESRFKGWMSLGYRYIDFTYEYDSGDSDLDLDATISGPYLSLEITF